MISSKSHGAAKRRRSQGLCLPESAVPARRLLPNRREACQSWPLGRVRREDVAAPTASTSAASASAAATTAAEQLPSVLPHGLHPATAARPGLRRHPAPQLHRSPRRSRPRSSPVRRRHEWRRLRGVIRRRGAGSLWDELPEPGRHNATRCDVSDFSPVSARFQSLLDKNVGGLRRRDASRVRPLVDLL
jgi:hypothetical protein